MHRSALLTTATIMRSSNRSWGSSRLNCTAIPRPWPTTATTGEISTTRVAKCKWASYSTTSDCTENSTTEHRPRSRRPSQELRDRDDDSISIPRGSRTNGGNFRSANFYILQSCAKELFHGRCTSPRYCPLTRRFLRRVAISNKFDVKVSQSANLSRETRNLCLESIGEAGRIGFKRANDYLLA